MLALVVETDPAEASFELREPVALRAGAGQWVLELLKGLLGNAEPPRTFYQHQVVRRRTRQVVYQVTTNNAASYRAAQSSLRQDLASMTEPQFLRKYTTPEPKLSPGVPFADRALKDARNGQGSVRLTSLLSPIDTAARA